MKFSTIALTAVATLGTSASAYTLHCDNGGPTYCHPPNMLALGKCRLIGGAQIFHREDNPNRMTGSMQAMVAGVCQSDDYCWSYYYQYCPQWGDYNGDGYGSG